MKRIIRLLAVILICAVLSVTAFAAEQTYVLEDVGMQINLPSDMIVLTRGMAENDPNLTAYGLVKSEIEAEMEAGSIYLSSWTSDVSCEIVVTMTEGVIGDYNLYGDAMLQTTASSIRRGYQDIGITVNGMQLHQHHQAKFFVLDLVQKSEEEVFYGLQYQTLYAGKGINVTLWSYTGEVSADQRSMMQGIVEGIQFDMDQQVSEDPTPTEKFAYYDPLSGIQFTVPANWKKDGFHNERGLLMTKFASLEEESVCMFFGVEDIWESLTDEEKAGLPRSDMNNNLFSKAEVAEVLDVPEDDIIAETFAGKEYFSVEFIETERFYDMTFQIPRRMIMRCENGYYYIFQLYGGHKEEHYEDFSALLNSAIYPEITPTEQSQAKPDRTDAEPVQNNAEAGRYEPEQKVKLLPNAGEFLLSLIVTIVIYSLPIMIYRYGIRKAPVEKKRARIIVIIYAFAAMIVMALLQYAISGSSSVGSAIALWSLFNYYVLTTGRKQFTFVSSETEQSDTEEQEKAPIANESTTRFCHNCGHQLENTSLYCSRCGTRVPENFD